MNSGDQRRARVVRGVTTRRRRWLLLPALVACVAAGLVAVAASSATAKSQRSAFTSASGKQIRVVVLAGATSDSFFSTVKLGVTDALSGGAKWGVKLTYLPLANYNNVGPDMARLEQTALGLHPSAVVTPIFVAPAQLKGIKALEKAHIPVFTYNSGRDQMTAAGALGYVGTNDFDAGRLAATNFLKAGVKNVVCINTGPGYEPSEQRCGGLRSGMKAGGGSAPQLVLPASSFADPTAIAQAVKGYIDSHSTLQGIFALGPQDADAVWTAIQQSGKTGKIKLGNADFGVNSIQRIENGQELFLVDQQPYLQGYYSASMAWQYAKWGLLPATSTIFTGPLLVNKVNAAQALAGAKDGVRGVTQ